MAEKLSNFPAIIYSGLWLLKTIGLLKKDFGTLDLQFLVLITDVPPAFMVRITKGDFQVEILDDVRNVEELNEIECDGYISLPSNVFLGGVKGIVEGLANKTVIVSSNEILNFLGKVGAAF